MRDQARLMNESNPWPRYLTCNVARGPMFPASAPGRGLASLINPFRRDFGPVAGVARCLSLALAMRVVLREHVLEIIAALPFWRRRLVSGSRNEGILGSGLGGAHQVRDIARAIREDLAFDAHDDFRAMMPAKRFRVVVDGGLAPDARAKRLAVEAHEQQPDVRVVVNVAERAVHVVAVVLGVLERVGSGDPDEAGIARSHGAIDIVLIDRCDEEEPCLFDELVVLLPELEVKAMLLEAVGDAAPVEAVLQLAHAIVVEGRAVDRVGHREPRSVREYNGEHARRESQGARRG